MKSILKISIVLIVIFSLEVSAHPRFAVRMNDKCIDCHYNPTGGLIRNDNGWFFGKNIMSLVTPREDEFATTPKIGDNISFGLDYRTQFLYSQEKQKSDFQQMTGSIYTNVALAKNINLIGRYDFIQKIWEAYGVAHFLPNNGYIKAGSFQPNYGIRLDDHTAYTRGGDFFLLFQNGARQGLIYNPSYIEAGVEAGIYISDWALLTASAGRNLSNNAFSKDPTYTGRLELNPSIGKVGLMLGGSYAAAKIQRTAEMYGFFFGLGINRFSLLAEVDEAKNISAQNITSNVLMVEVAYVVYLGVEAVVRFDWLDPNKDISKDEVSHLILGFEFFPYAFIEIRPQYRFVLEDTAIDNDSFVLQFHFWY